MNIFSYIAHSHVMLTLSPDKRLMSRRRLTLRFSTIEILRFQCPNSAGHLWEKKKNWLFANYVGTQQVRFPTLLLFHPSH